MEFAPMETGAEWVPEGVALEERSFLPDDEADLQARKRELQELWASAEPVWRRRAEARSWDEDDLRLLSLRS